MVGKEVIPAGGCAQFGPYAGRARRDDREHPVATVRLRASGKTDPRSGSRQDFRSGWDWLADRPSAHGRAFRSYGPAG